MRKNDKYMMRLLTALVGTAMAGTLLAGCGSTSGSADQKASTGDTAEAKDSGAQDSADQSQQSAAEHTVTFYDSDGTTVLNTVTVGDGETVEPADADKDGYTFVGWFATPQMTHDFDFTQPITAETSVFGGFVTYTEDTRDWYIVGNGTSPALLESSWGAVCGDAQKLTREENAEANIYTITLDLAEGDEFQFAVDSSWHDQRGYGYLDTAAIDGTTYFDNAGGLGAADTTRSNIKTAVAGNYTFTLTTYPGEDTYDTENANYTEDNKEGFNSNLYDSISFVYNGESKGEVADSTTDYYIKGAKITDWQDVYTDETRFTEDNGIYTLTIDLEEGDEFLITTLVTVGDKSSVGTEYVRYTNIAEDDTESLSYVTGATGGMGGANMVAVASGTYTFTYDPSTQILTVSFE